MLEAALALLAGLLIGSFLNVCVYRLPRDLSVVRPRSHCPACDKLIAWYDNIPLVSYVVLAGRCRHCGDKIPLRYPIVELATGLAFALCVSKLGLSLPALKFSVFSAIMIALIATDIEERILPDEFTLGGMVVGLVFAWFLPLEIGLAGFFLPWTLGRQWVSVADAALAAGVASGSIWLVAWLYQKLRHREGMGLGDVKMIAMIGAFLGLSVALLTLVVASLFGSIIGVPYAFFAKRKLARRLAVRIRRRQQERSVIGPNLRALMVVASRYQLPFGSFLGLAALVLALWGYVVKPGFFGG
jgi:leader peptidase (prepilin peptidase)/N-methyltransferase